MSIDWTALLIVILVSLAAGVAVVSLVAFALVGFSARAMASDGRHAVISPRAGAVIGSACLVAASLIVLYGLYVIVAVH